MIARWLVETQQLRCNRFDSFLTNNSYTYDTAMTTLIFANGDIDVFGWIHPFILDASLIIAADGGTRYLFSLNKPPNVVIGDLDSVSAEIKRWIEQNEVELVQFSAEKDETDLDLALLYAVEQSNDPIRVFGASGGRIDQATANLLLLGHPDLIDRDIRLVEQYQQAWVARTTANVDGQAGDTLSLIPVGGDALITRTTNLKWPLINSRLRWAFARGISNVLTASHATVEIAEGNLLCIHLDQSWDR